MENIILTRCFSKFFDIGKEFCQGIKIDSLEIKIYFTGNLIFHPFSQIEPNQESFAQLLQRNRKALALNSCVSPTTLSESFTFVSNPFESHNAGFLGGISEFLELTKDGVLQAKYEQHFADGHGFLKSRQNYNFLF